MSITPKAIQDLLDDLERSKQSRLRAWNVLQRLRSVLSDLGNTAIPPPAQKTFDAEGEVLEHALTKSFRIWNGAIKSLCSSVRRFWMRPSRKSTKAIIRTHYRHCGNVGSGGGSHSELSYVRTLQTNHGHRKNQPGKTLRCLVRESERCAVF
jgi:hypothetical protein